MNKQNGMRTKAWGPPAWMFLHMVTMGYPYKNPTKTQKKQYKTFFKNVGNILPCGLCRNSYKKFLKEIPITEEVLKSRKNLVHWFFKVHNRVNKKLNCEVLNRKQLNEKYRFYESFRAGKCGKDVAGCTKAQNQKKIPNKTKIIIIKDIEALDDNNKMIIK